MPICKSCQLPFKRLNYIDGRRIILCETRVNCLECTPYNSAKLKQAINKTKVRICNLCDKRKTRSSRFAKCQTCYVSLRRYRLRVAIIKALGGRCSVCGWSGDQVGFDIHHKDPSIKEFKLTKAAHKSWDKIIKEVSKCILLCACCHRIHHSNKNEKFIREAESKPVGM